MPTNRFICDHRALDITLTMASGQCFLWDVGSSPMTGTDGRFQYSVTAVDGGYEVTTNGTQAEWDWYVRSDWAFSELRDSVEAEAPHLSPILDRYPGLRVLRQSDPLEALLGFACSANNSLHRIVPMARFLAQNRSRLPTITESELRSQRFGYRGATIPKLIAEIDHRGGGRYLHSLKTVGYPEAHRNLVALPGIGRKIADCVCLFGLDYGEAVPIDTHIWQSAGRVLSRQWANQPLTEPRYRAVGDWLRQRFGHQAGWVQQFLFLENRDFVRAARPQ